MSEETCKTTCFSALIFCTYVCDLGFLCYMYFRGNEKITIPFLSKYVIVVQDRVRFITVRDSNAILCDSMGNAACEFKPFWESFVTIYSSTGRHVSGSKIQCPKCHLYKRKFKQVLEIYNISPAVFNLLLVLLLCITSDYFLLMKWDACISSN